MPFETRELMVQLLTQYETDIEKCGNTCLFGTIGPEAGKDFCGPKTNIPCHGHSHLDLSPCVRTSVRARADENECFTKVHEILGAMALGEIQRELENQKGVELARAAIRRLSGT